MASTLEKQRQDATKIGYLQKVSQLKTSKKYFNATLQTQTSYENVGSFKKEEHKTFVDISKAKQVFNHLSIFSFLFSDW